MELKVYLLIGCPGSGKSTWGKTVTEINPNIVRICPDTIRGELSNGDESNQSVSGQAFNIAKSRMNRSLNDGKSVLIDATNMYRKSRKDFLDIARRYNAKTIAVVFEVDEKTAIERNKKRADSGGRNVPTDVIQKMLSRYERPTNDEFDEVTFISKT